MRSALDPSRVATETLYDLASVTKPFVAVTTARLAHARRIDWDAPLGAVVTEAADTPSATASLEALASHRAGLCAHQALFEPMLRGEMPDRSNLLRQAALARRPGCDEPSEAEHPPLYSDLGYLLLGEALSRATATPLDELVADQIARPLDIEVGSAAQWRVRDAARLARAAPTETVAFRGGEVVGEAHDENAWAFARLGLAGHAGLFGTALAVARMGAVLIDALEGRAPDFLLPDEVERLVRARPGGTLRAGFDGKSVEGSSAGSRFGENSFGHLGFTGTSLWCDPETHIVACALTNRVCPTREHTLIRGARPMLHDALFEAAEALRGSGG
jgi:CubicO group peptidase (beta-lactamase class C family)